MHKLDIIAGARPNFMKIGPIIHTIHDHNEKNPGSQIQYRLIHAGQHYDKKMSTDFFTQLNIPEPHLNLGVEAQEHRQNKPGRSCSDMKKHSKNRNRNYVLWWVM